VNNRLQVADIMLLEACFVMASEVNFRFRIKINKHFFMVSYLKVFILVGDKTKS